MDIQEYSTSSDSYVPDQTFSSNNGERVVLPRQPSQITTDYLQKCLDFIPKWFRLIAQFAKLDLTKKDHPVLIFNHRSRNFSIVKPKTMPANSRVFLLCEILDITTAALQMGLKWPNPPKIEKGEEVKKFDKIKMHISPYTNLREGLAALGKGAYRHRQGLLGFFNSCSSYVENIWSWLGEYWTIHALPKPKLSLFSISFYSENLGRLGQLIRIISKYEKETLDSYKTSLFGPLRKEGEEINVCINRFIANPNSFKKHAYFTTHPDKGGNSEAFKKVSGILKNADKLLKITDTWEVHNQSLLHFKPFRPNSLAGWTLFLSSVSAISTFIYGILSMKNVVPKLRIVEDIALNMPMWASFAMVSGMSFFIGHNRYLRRISNHALGKKNGNRVNLAVRIVFAYLIPTCLIAKTVLILHVSRKLVGRHSVWAFKNYRDWRHFNWGRDKLPMKWYLSW